MLSITYQYAEDLTDAEPVRVTVSRGKVLYELHAGGLFLPAGVAALNATTAQLTAGGTIRQRWRGETIPPVDKTRVAGSDDGWIHRGPVADETPRPHHR